ncbi:MAG: hypothetical protein HKN20_09515 [Gemmatimonadetes bacterium]|nr:hypothetical protein [Gemmatimonadota bacterium]
MSSMRIAVLALLVGYSVAAAGGSERTPIRGPLPAEQRELIHLLAMEHEGIDREVVLTDSGYVATTTSEDPKIVAALRDHVDYMKMRIESGAMVRRWDPAFRELVEHSDDIVTTLVVLEDGLRMHVTGLTPVAVRVAWNHARIVTGFVEEGEAAVQREHATTADEERAPEADPERAP